MRELKFRVWIPDRKKFEYFRLGEFYLSDRYLHQNSHPVQQSSGIFDSFGLELYEGDIVTHGCNTQKYESIVSYSAPSFIYNNYYYEYLVGSSWKIEWPRNIEYISNNIFRQNMIIGNSNYSYVIGNIYETPDILSSTKTYFK